MLCENVTTVKRGTFIKKEVKNVPSQYKKFPPFENRLKTGYVLDLHSVHSAPDINFPFTVYTSRFEMPLPPLIYQDFR